MGGSLAAVDEQIPTFYIWALKDPERNDLERIQIVKGWLDRNGKTHEMVFDVACASDVEIDPNTNRCELETVELDVLDCAEHPVQGSAELRTLWVDPTYSSSERAFYYVRALETPTCRWSTWDALRNNVKPDSRVPVAIQERAWSSPVWIEPVLD